MNTEEKKSESAENVVLHEFCEKGGHDLINITETPNYKICQTCRRYYEVNEDNRIIRELTQGEFYGREKFCLK